MSGKRVLSGAAVTLAVLTAATAAKAGTPSIGLALPANAPAFVTVDYDDPENPGYGARPYYGAGPLEIPGQVIGGVFSALGGAFTASDPYNDPNYGSDYYGRDYNSEPGYIGEPGNRGYYGGSGYSGLYRGGYGSAYSAEVPYPSYPSYSPNSSSAYSHSIDPAYEESGFAACQRTFRSFDPVSGTYIDDDGEVVPCPYLER
jgi:hypothetical protein